MRMETCIRRSFRMKSHYVERVEESEAGWVAFVQRIGRRKLRCQCGLATRRVHSRGRVRRWKDLSVRDKPLWLIYRVCRVVCRSCGVVTEQLPWAERWARVTRPLAQAVARLARQMSWKQVACHYGLDWKTVAAVVRRAVAYGLAHRKRRPLRIIGIDEVSRKKGHHYLTLVYDLERKELVWIGQDRTEATLDAFFAWLGKRRSRNLQVACLDMWKPYLASVRQHAPQATTVFDRFHLIRHLNHALDLVRRQQWRKAGAAIRGVIKGTRYLLLMNPWTQSRQQRQRLLDLVDLNIPLVRAYLLKEDFQLFWYYRQPARALAHLQKWYRWARRCRLEPIKDFAALVQRHRDGILAWTKLRVSNGALEGMNNKIKLVSHRSFGFRNPDNYISAIYHSCANLPLP